MKFRECHITMEEVSKIHPSEAKEFIETRLKEHGFVEELSIIQDADMKNHRITYRQYYKEEI